MSTDPSFAAAVARLAAAGCIGAEGEAAELIAAAPDGATLDAWLVRRERGEPLEWITGRVLFCGRRLRVGPGVYVPRVQTEGLAVRAAALLGPEGRAIDLCTGAGAIAAHLVAEVPTAAVVAVDRDLRAAQWARRNGVATLVADLAAPVADHRPFDLVTAVAPYVPTSALALLPRDVREYAPRLALDGGRDGLDVVRRLIDAAARLLRPGGWLLIELGGDQDRAVLSYLAAGGFDPATAWHDDEGDLRGIVARRGRHGI
ncbi:MAG: HemK/PrmC family methyltransferase [Acidimicrobiia bacterium]